MVRQLKAPQSSISVESSEWSYLVGLGPGGLGKG